MGQQSLIYNFVARGTVVLAEFTGNFTSIASQCLQKLPSIEFIAILIAYPPVYPVGGSDLFPGPCAGMYPTRGDFGIGGGDMFVGPDHPMFGGMGRGIGPLLPGGLPGVPPGARFDPYGPPGVPGFEPNRFARDPRRPRGGTHPDLEHYQDGSDYI